MGLKIRIPDKARVVMIQDYEGVTAAFVNLAIDALDANLAHAIASVWFGAGVCGCVWGSELICVGAQ